MQTIVIGHRNPDMDSIVSALAYAELKRQLGDTDVVAARAGTTNERIDFVLEKFGVAEPVLINDLSPRVADVMQPHVISVRADSPVYDAIQLIENKRLRGLPVVDGGNRCLGLLSAFKITHHLFPPRDEAASARVVTASLADIVTTFGGALVCGSLAAEPSEHTLMVAAMEADSFSERLDRYREQRLILFVGNRPRILERAIEARVQAIVVTGGLAIEEETRVAARSAGVTMISSPHDTATTVLLARGAVRVESMIETEFTTFLADTPLDEARRVAADSAAFVFPVINDDGALVGILSKSDFLKELPRQLILVDHNELSQAVRGADRVPIIEILDHHKLGGFSTDTPILFWNNPVGSTSTIVSLAYQNAGIEIPRPIAGLLMAGLISDTLNLSSPTATAVDRAILADLSKITGCNPTQLAEQIFSVGSPLLTMSPEQAINADCKAYNQDDERFTVAQVEELSFAHFHEKRNILLEALEAHRSREGLLFAALLVTDINTQNSLLLVRGADEFLRTIDYPETGPFVWELNGVVSRKKQLLPYLLGCLERMTG
ncbi:MAG TPA: putative manganese-dependent inorganic diphosphatase [Chthoniobacteraceae bacterium]|nr:putative manganese-dependent inorganic diphosphatase [Chthoniobacteraceae bacterium]